MFRPIVLLALLVFFSFSAAADPAQPKVDETALIAWAAGTVTQALTFDFEDYQKVLDHAKHNFSPEGWQALQATLQQSGLQENVKVTRASLKVERGGRGHLTTPPPVG